MSIVIETTKIKIYGYLQNLCAYAGLSVSWGDELWQEMLRYKDLYEEFIYYLENHTFLDKLKVSGYGLSELYVWQMNEYNIVHEIGKNPTTCNKETMVLIAFKALAHMQTEPERYIKRIESGWGGDIL